MLKPPVRAEAAVLSPFRSVIEVHACIAEHVYALAAGVVALAVKGVPIIRLVVVVIVLSMEEHVAVLALKVHAVPVEVAHIVPELAALLFQRAVAHCLLHLFGSLFVFLLKLLKLLPRLLRREKAAFEQTVRNLLVI